MDRKKTSASDIVFFMMLLSAPLALGATHFFSKMILAACALVLFYLHFCRRLEPARFKALLFQPYVLSGLMICAAAAFQIIPLPARWIRFISVNTLSIYETYAGGVGPGSFLTLSIYPWATIFEACEWISYCLVFLFIVSRCGIGSAAMSHIAKALTRTEQEHAGHRPFQATPFHSCLRLGLLTAVLSILFHSIVDFNMHIPANALYFTVILALSEGIRRALRRGAGRINFIEKTASAVIFTGFCIAVFSIVQKFSSNGKIYWLITKEGGNFGPYINYDHFAGYMEMCTSVAIAAFIGHIRTSTFFKLTGWKEKALWFSSHEANKTLLYIFFSAVMTSSLFLSTSRGGILSFCAANIISFIFLLIRFKKSLFKRALLGIVLVVSVTSLAVIWFGPQEWAHRFKGINDLFLWFIKEPPVLNEIRPMMWSDTLRMFLDFPVTGTGFGTFAHIYPLYRTFEWGTDFLRYPHCDYLQIISETGVFGIAFIASFLGIFLTGYANAVKHLK